MATLTKQEQAKLDLRKRIKGIAIYFAVVDTAICLAWIAGVAFHNEAFNSLALGALFGNAVALPVLVLQTIRKQKKAEEVDEDQKA